MRLKEREIHDPEIMRGILQKSDCCHVAFNDGDFPYIVTMNYGYEFDGETITLYFHCARRGKKLDVLRNDNRVCFTMDCSHEYIKNDPNMYCTCNYESIVGFGVIEEISDPEEYEKGVHLLLQHHDCDGGFELTPNHIRATNMLKLTSTNFTGKKKLYVPVAMRNQNPTGEKPQEDFIHSRASL